MPCNNRCCPPHEFFATRDPLPTDCADSVVPGYETEGGFCTGSYWRNTVTGQIFIGVNDMACDTAEWMATNNLLTPLDRVKVVLGASVAVPPGAFTQMTFGTVAWDETSAYDAVNYEFTASRDSIYRVEFAPQLTTTSGWAVGDVIDGQVMVNGVNRGASGSFMFQHNTGIAQVFPFIQPILFIETKLVAGDIVTVEVYHTNDNSVTFDASNSVLYINEIPMSGVFP